MKRPAFHRVDWMYISLLMFWGASVVLVYAFLHTHHIPLRLFPRLVRREVLEAGAWGPVIILLLYATQTIIPFPTAGLATVSGAVYGPWAGTMLVLLGLILSATISFGIGRFFAEHWSRLHDSAWMKKYRELLEHEGFMTVIVLRLLMFPFDIVGIGCGMSSMSFRSYLLATLLGMIPGTVTFVVLGRALTNPRAWLLFVTLLSVSLVGAWIVRRFPSLQRRG